MTARKKPTSVDRLLATLRKRAAFWRRHSKSDACENIQRGIYDSIAIVERHRDREAKKARRGKTKPAYTERGRRGGRG
jgi:hypothetical protein